MRRLFGIGAGILFAAPVAPAFAVPNIIGYQGKLSDTTGVPILKLRIAVGV
jgi:hypothetical protein